jgi:hypothetical protein
MGLGLSKAKQRIVSRLLRLHDRRQENVSRPYQDIRVLPESESEEP